MSTRQDRRSQRRERKRREAEEENAEAAELVAARLLCEHLRTELEVMQHRERMAEEHWLKRESALREQLRVTEAERDSLVAADPPSVELTELRLRVTGLSSTATSLEARIKRLDADVLYWMESATTWRVDAQSKDARVTALENELAEAKRAAAASSGRAKGPPPLAITEDEWRVLVAVAHPDLHPPGRKDRATAAMILLNTRRPSP